MKHKISAARLNVFLMENTLFPVSDNNDISFVARTSVKEPVAGITLETCLYC